MRIPMMLMMLMMLMMSRFVRSLDANILMRNRCGDWRMRHYRRLDELLYEHIY